MHWQPESLAQVFGKRLHLVGLNSFGAAHPQGQADNNLPDVVFLNHELQLFKVVSLVSALQRFQSLSGNPQGIGHRYANPPRPYIEAQNPANRKFTPRPILGIVGLGPA